MRCPFCGVDEDRVIDSRSIGEGSAIRRRRACSDCGKRFTTYERIEVAPRVVVKKDAEREPFSREKILAGMLKACEKRNISLDELENVVAKLEAELFAENDSEIATRMIGERVSEALKRLDHVAYVRFASVYRDFKDLNEFLEELHALQQAAVGSEGSEKSESAKRSRESEHSVGAKGSENSSDTSDTSDGPDGPGAPADAKVAAGSGGDRSSPKKRRADSDNSAASPRSQLMQSGSFVVQTPRSCT